jgi:hypothetical protein
VSASPPDTELPDELAALHALASAPVIRPDDRAERATRSATVYLAERRQRLRRASDAET